MYTVGKINGCASFCTWFCTFMPVISWEPKAPHPSKHSQNHEYYASLILLNFCNVF